MSQHRRYVFVLWADQFEEAPATIFVTELREAGLRVKVVGLTPQPISGSHGLALTPDLTMERALSLADQTICLVIPQSLAGLHSLKTDPRLQKLFELACKNQARLVMGPLNGLDLCELELFPPSVVDQVMIYPEGEDLLKFTRELAGLLGED